MANQVVNINIRNNQPTTFGEIKHLLKKGDLILLRPYLIAHAF